MKFDKVIACQAPIVRAGVIPDTCGHSVTGHDQDGCFVCRTVGYVGWVHQHLAAIAEPMPAHERAGVA